MRLALVIAFGLCLSDTGRTQCTGPTLLFDSRYEHLAVDYLLAHSSVAMVGDLDRQRGPDIVFAPTGAAFASVQVFLNTGAGTCIRTLYSVPSDQFAMGATLGDVDRDGDLDIVLLREGPTAPLFLINDSQGGFTVEPLGSRIADLLQAKSVCCADFDGDGWSDLFIGMQGAGQCRIYLNDRTGGFVDATLTHLPWAVQGCAQNVTAADLDGDTDLDIVIAMGGWCGPKQENVVLLNDGLGHLTPVVLAGIRRWSHTIAVGDFDGDSRPDLFFGALNDPPELWHNLGQGNFADASARLPAAATSTVGAVATDVNGDGWNDLLVGVVRPAGYRAEAYVNQLGQSFTLDTTIIQQPPGSGLQVYYLHAADMDADGDVDLVVGGHSPPYNTTGLKILVHSRRHVLPALSPTIGQPWPIALWARPRQIVFPAMSAGTAQIPLGSLGLLGLDPATIVGFPLVDMRACRQTISVAMPNMPVLRGRSLYWQACVVDLAQPSETRLTNWTADTIQ